jgi:MoxR-like ATPase
MFNIKIDYPSFEEEVAIVKSTTSGIDNELNIILDRGDLLLYQDLVRRVPIADNVIEFAVDLVSKTRPQSDKAFTAVSDWIEWGAGPRASQYLVLGAKAKAVLDGRPAPEIDDIKAMARPVLRHRLITNFNAEAEGLSTDDILSILLEKDTK